MEFYSLCRFLLRRIVKSVLVVIAIVIGNFLLIHAAPGDPASVMAGESGAADPQFMAQLRHQFGLDQPLSTQLVDLYRQVCCTLDLGFAIASRSAGRRR